MADNFNLLEDFFLELTDYIEILADWFISSIVFSWISTYTLNILDILI